ncbi:DUF535 family protein [Helicobacter felis]|uniref:DUF535 family protein n=2 Tax=Helicobacter felis TaxID=214 RepID=UPI001F294EF2|nr:DUF535 family protein [Helicobacter felis]
MQIEKILKQARGKMRSNTHVERLKSDMRRVIKTCKSFSKRVVLLSFEVVWRLFPNFCRINCLRILKVLWWFSRRDSELNVAILQQINCDHGLDERIWQPMLDKMENWLKENGILMRTLLTLVPHEKVFERFFAVYLGFGDARLTHTERMEWLVFNLKILQNLQAYDGSERKDFLTLRRVEFYTFIDAGGGGTYSFCLALKHYFYTEGFLTLEILYKKENISTLYHSSFCITPQLQLLVACVQGGKGLTQEHVKFLTKHCCCHPAAFLAELQKILTRILGLNTTLGIPGVAQVSYARSANHQGLIRDYDDFFMKRGADEVDLVEIEGRSYYNLPHTHRDITYYPQKKRSIRKKRWKLLDEIENNLQGRLVIKYD